MRARRKEGDEEERKEMKKKGKEFFKREERVKRTKEEKKRERKIKRVRARVCFCPDLRGKEKKNERMGTCQQIWVSVSSNKQAK